MKFDGNDTGSKPIFCGEDNLLFGDYEKVKSFLKCPVHDIYEYKDIFNEFKTMHEHMDTYLNEVIFVKCSNKTCCGDFHLQEIVEFFGGIDKVKFPSQTLSEDRKSHCTTLLEETVNENKKYGHVRQPSSQENDLGKCDHCTSCYFKCKTETKTYIGLPLRKNK